MTKSDSQTIKKSSSTKESKPKEPKEPKEAKSGKDAKKEKQPKPVRESKAVKEPKEPKVTKESSAKSGDDDKKIQRQQISKLIGINLSVSRVRRHIDKNSINADIESALDELATLIAQEADGKKVDAITPATQSLITKAYEQIYDSKMKKYQDTKAKLTAATDENSKTLLKNLGDGPTKDESLKEKKDLVSKMRCRFSNNASIVLSTALDYVVQELVHHAMINAHQSGKAIIQVKHIFSDSLSTLPIYPLISNLKIVLAQKDKKAGADEAEPAEAEPAEAEPAEDESGTSFEFYVNLICKNVKAKLVESNADYSHIRVSKNIRRYCSDIVVQLIERLSPLIKLYAHTAKIKTINDEVIRFVIRMILLDSGITESECIKRIDSVLDIYNQQKEVEA
jgi:histone H3/H4